MTFDLPLALGTVQLGMPYGIANHRGQPDYAEARAIVAAAHDCGVAWLDTAAAYGESEAVLGRALRDLGLTGRMQVVTKVPDLADVPAEAVGQRMEEVLCESLRLLGLERLPMVLFHRETDIGHLEALRSLRDRGLVERTGVSVMTPDAFAEMLALPGMEAVQAPGSALDQRFAREGLLRRARERGTIVFIRSVYLQGLLLMPEAEVPPVLAEVLPVRQALEALASEAGLSLAELALRFVLSETGVNAVVVGAESVEQVRVNAAYARRGPLPTDLAAAVRAAVPELPDRLIVPHLWSRKPPS